MKPDVVELRSEYEEISLGSCSSIPEDPRTVHRGTLRKWGRLYSRHGFMKVGTKDKLGVNCGV